MKWAMIQKSPPINELSTQQIKAKTKRTSQGIAIRGHTETEGNLHQLLITWASDNAGLKCWLQENKYVT